MAKLLIALGLALAVIGLVLLYFPGLLNGFGRLPGDIRIEGKRGGFYFPIVSMLIVSVLLSLLLHWWRR
jgi:hypothetical protein